MQITHVTKKIIMPHNGIGIMVLRYVIITQIILLNILLVSMKTYMWPYMEIPRSIQIKSRG
jgi:hypothetical protein